ncbi:histidine phosphatase family protein [Methyloversatilis thermotolerans]|uniref:histidine phosphatase family protein n=1 Tax=Methyloversatilis thermotolerans TaxID=1346290 RepID=UPI000377880C|nr:histidine phosphatase family protein [Methyloversatilis thermotolerans]
MDKRRFCLTFVTLPLLPAARAAQPALQSLRGGGVLLLRHARTDPGIGDPPGFRIDDCATQRNLSAEGRQQAKRSGEALVEHGIRFDAVWSSAWCRCIDTARLMVPQQQVVIRPELNSFFAGQGDRESQTRALRGLITSLPVGHRVLAVTHQVNILALCGEDLAMGEAVVLGGGQDGTTRVIGRLTL